MTKKRINESHEQLQRIIKSWEGHMSDRQIEILRRALLHAEERGRLSEREAMAAPGAEIPGGIERLDCVNMNMLLRRTFSQRNLPLLIAVAGSMLRRGFAMQKPNVFRSHPGSDVGEASLPAKDDAALPPSPEG
ncbi:hypothetical protein [Acetobacter malorum]|nr:hypothetical protein [Acetobacter malorum]KXV06708.1 hypothetical protein AD930_06280 [Acetobacter malorum]